MDPTRLAVFLVTALGGIALASGQDLSCIEEMEVPPFGPIAHRDQVSGDVKATVTIGLQGEPARIQVESRSKSLAREVELYLRHDTRYSVHCAGKVVQIEFTFVLEGAAVDRPCARIRFRPPNRFMIISRPQVPYLFKGPSPPAEPRNRQEPPPERH